MTVSYNKLWKLLIDRKISAADLRKETNMAPNTLTKLRKDEVVSLTVLMSICEYLNCDIGDVCEFVQEFLSYTTVDGNVVTTTIPKSAVEIQPNAFSGLGELQSIVIPPTVKKIGSWAFLLVQCTSQYDFARFCCGIRRWCISSLFLIGNGTITI